MKPEDIKVGETYYARVKVDRMDVDSAWCLLIDESGKGNRVQKFYKWMLYAFSPIPTPKYDPCRKLKVGDVVRVLKINGNLPKCKWAGNIPKEGVTGIVRELRKEDHFVWIDCKGIVCYCIDPAYLELVTPVEELEPYYVKETASVYEVFNRNENNSSVAIFFKSQYSIEKAKERAESERDRLNEEYRKEQK
jgi:hypothetical protein